MASGIVLGAGYILAGLIGGTNFLALVVLIGGVGGAGIGLGYVVPIAVAMRWFPDKKGMITGLAVAGFRFRAPWAGSRRRVPGATWSPTWVLSTTFVIYGVAFIIMVCVGAMWMVFPPEGWLPAGLHPPRSPPPAPARRPLPVPWDFNSG